MLEGQVSLQRNGSTKNLSPQQLMDCNVENRGWCVFIFLLLYVNCVCTVVVCMETT